jgi:SAM-dependent methyltransferase
LSTTEGFYDGLASIYDLIYEDWLGSIERQADALETLIRAQCPTAKTIADVACGIGTQSLGLAAKGFDVTASDISRPALARAEREAAARGLHIRFRIDDMEQLTSFDSGSADVLIACDNAVPHLLSDERLLNAFRRFRDVLAEGGLCVISVRDYAALPRGGVQLVPFGVRRRGSDRVAVFQVWDWEGDQYRLDMYFVFDDGRRVETRVFRSRYYGVTIARLIELMSEAGFTGVERVDGVFFQPLLVGHKR